VKRLQSGFELQKASVGKPVSLTTALKMELYQFEKSLKKEMEKEFLKHCIKSDMQWGIYPEHRYEGREIASSYFESAQGFTKVQFKTMVRKALEIVKDIEVSRVVSEEGSMNIKKKSFKKDYLSQD
jgi:hypothetical protein